MDIKTSRALS